MSTRSQAILSQIQALPPDEQQEVFSHVLVWFKTTESAVVNADPIRSARGMLAGTHLTEALMKHRQEERRRG